MCFDVLACWRSIVKRASNFTRQQRQYAFSGLPGTGSSHAGHTTFRQSVNQSANQLMKQEINELMNQSINHSLNQINRIG